MFQKFETDLIIRVEMSNQSIGLLGWKQNVQTESVLDELVNLYKSF